MDIFKFNSTHTTKIIQKQNNNLKQYTILYNFKSSSYISEEVTARI